MIENHGERIGSTDPSVTGPALLVSLSLIASVVLGLIARSIAGIPGFEWVKPLVNGGLVMLGWILTAGVSYWTGWNQKQSEEREARERRACRACLAGAPDPAVFVTRTELLESAAWLATEGDVGSMDDTEFRLRAVTTMRALIRDVEQLSRRATL